MSVPQGPAGVLALRLAAVRAQLPDLVLREGATLAARVAERAPDGRHGLITLAGAVLVAELPETVKAGEQLRLRVSEVAGERVVLRLEPPPTAAIPSATPIPLPDGRGARVEVDEPPARARPDGDAARVAVTYHSSRLGAIGLELELTSAGITARVACDAGDAHDLALARADELRDTLARELGRAAAVHVSPRRRPVDLYA